MSVKPDLLLWWFMETMPSVDLGAQLAIGEGNEGAVCLGRIKLCNDKYLGRTNAIAEPAFPR
jgi:hypothetical protein